MTDRLGGIAMLAFGILLISGARRAAEDRRGDYKRRRRQRRKERSRFTRFIMWEARPPSVRASTLRTRFFGGLIAALGVCLIVSPSLFGVFG